MNLQITKSKDIEKVLAVIILFAVFVFIPYKIIKSGYLPTDDANRHIAYSISNKAWTDVLEIQPSLSADHNAGWHFLLKLLHKYLGLDKKALLITVIIGLFLIFNLTGSLVSPNIAAWSIVLIIIFLFDRGFFYRILNGRPLIISCISTLILLKLWFIESEKPTSSLYRFLVSVFLLILSVWLHGTWYTFLILPFALFLAGKTKKAFALTFTILISTFFGAFLTGEFSEFLHFHYSATLNIFTEKIYNWQLVTEFAEGNIHTLWVIPTVIIIFLLHYSNKLRLNDLTKDPLFIMVLLCWLLSIRVIRFWDDWGLIALMLWLSFKFSDLIQEMQSVKKAFFRRFLFILVVLSTVLLLPSHKWNNQKERESYSVDFSKAEFADFKPLEGGIIYNDAMRHFYYQYYADPDGKYKFVLGFEPAIMIPENRTTLREITYSSFHYSSYKPWIDKLTAKDRIFTSEDISPYYPQLDWIKANRHLWIGKLPNNNE